MRYLNNFWYFQSVIPPKLCDDIITFGENVRQELALVGELADKKQQNPNISISKKELRDLKKVRDSNIAWLKEPWIYKEILPYVQMANINAEWNFQFDYAEAMQFTKYKINQFYNWHFDSFISPYQNLKDENYNGKIRKLSVTVSLSDQKDYEGGSLEFDIQQKNGKKDIITCDQIVSKGSVIVFPSFIYHRVKPVTKGTRYSLVIWFLGKPYI